MDEKLKKWQVIYLDNVRYLVYNMIEYFEDSWIWQEYEIRSDNGDTKWLCVEKNENNQVEYSIYVPYHERIDSNQMSINLNGVIFEMAEKGTAKVLSYFGNADVDIGERCKFIDYMTQDGKYVLSVESWSGDEEYSYGEYIDPSRIRITNERDQTKIEEDKKTTKFAGIICLFYFGFMLLPVFGSFLSGIFINKSIMKYLDKNTTYTYVTSMTNNVSNKVAKLYTSPYQSIDTTVKDIIDGVPEGITSTIDSDPTTENDGIGLHTNSEYAYVYLEEDTVYVQVSPKDYITSNNTTNNTYHRHRNYHYYRSYSSTNTSSTYSSYASSARQQSINSRKSSGGGTSSGK